MRTADALATTPLRGSTGRGRATRDRIAAAGSRLVQARGVEGTPLEDVRAATGVSESQPCHFTDKTDVFRAVVAWQDAAVLAAQQPELDAADSLAALKRWRDKVVAPQEEHRVGLDAPSACPSPSWVTTLRGERWAASSPAVARTSAPRPRRHAAER